MIIRVLYTTQLKHALQRSSDKIDFAETLTVGQLLLHLSQLHGETFDKMVLAGPDELNPSILVCVGDECLGRDLSARLSDGDEVTLLSPVSGG